MLHIIYCLLYVFVYLFFSMFILNKIINELDNIPIHYILFGSSLKTNQKYFLNLHLDFFF